MNQETLHTKLLQYKSFFWSPNYLDPYSAWIEHIPFAFWLIEVLQPKTIVELGVHGGSSYFSFCQAVKLMNINSVCYGVDTWRGDEHAGFYDEQVFQKVNSNNEKEYSRFSTLIRSTFDEAREYFVDKSISLLHIDGLHTYEAVKHDFEAWLPKLSDDGYFIFHDINVRERNFGVFRLWEELKEKYAHFQFDFGHGLGIIALGDASQEELAALVNKDESYYAFLRNIFSERGNFIKVISRGEATITNQSNQLSTLGDLSTKLEADNKTLQAEVANLAGELNNLRQHNAQLKESNREFEAAGSQLKAGMEALGSTNSQLLQNYKDLSDLNEKLKEDHTTLELKKDELQQQYQKEITDGLKKLKDTDELLNNVSGELAATRKENETHKRNLIWYRDTYESRSILGVLKTKMSSLLKKKIKDDSRYTGDNDKNAWQEKDYFNLIPASGIRLTKNRTYSATGSDPYFLIDLRNKVLHAGWHWLSILISTEEGVLLSPRLYLDHGFGFNEEDVWNLPKPNNGKIECLIYFKSDLQQLRFDPSTIECVFTLDSFCLKKASRLKALKVSFSRYRKIYASSDNYFLAFSELLSLLFRSGARAVKSRLWDAVHFHEDRTWEKYTNWCELYDTITEDDFSTIRSLSNTLQYKPLFSIVMPVYNVPVKYLKKAIDSVERQAYENWELCIADDKSTNKKVIKFLKTYQHKDKRIKIVFRDGNGGISKASNSALEVATGDYMVLLDNDDEMTPHALYMVAKAINDNKELQLIYSDEDKLDEEGNRYEPYFKTDWNSDLFYGQNMINHLGVYKLSLVKEIGGFRSQYDGSQDYDLVLRCLEHLKPGQIHHIPHVLYHWRAIAGSVALSINSKSSAVDAGLNALKDHLKRTNQKAVAEANIHSSYRVKWQLNAQPSVSIVIPTKDKRDVLATCINSIVNRTRYKNYEVLVIDNDSRDQSTLEYLKMIQAEYRHVKVYNYKSEFNFSAIVNYGVRQSTADVIVLLNNDTEVINDDWLHEMVSQCSRKEVGAVGAKLFYPNGQIQHAGVVLYEGHPGNHIYLRKDKNDAGYFNKLNLVQEYSAVTAACLAVRRELYLELGGFDEKNLKVAYNDVDFCLKAKEAGYRNVWTPFAQLFHYESLSRGNDFDEKNYTRFMGEQGYMLEKWNDAIVYDPYFNPNLGFDTRTNQVAFPPRITYEWKQEKVSSAVGA